MAVLQKIRVKFGLAISIIIALALLSFIIDPSTLESALHSMSSKYDVGQIAGKSVSYTDFQEEVDKYTTINQIITGSSVQNEASQKQIRDAAWQALVDKFMFVKNAKAAGIVVGEDEMLDLTTGSNVSPMISQNPAFVNENGVFSADKLREFTSGISSDQTGRLKLYWSYLQNTIHTQQYYAKYGALFTNGYFVNALTEERLLDQQNTTVDVDYVAIPFDYADSTVKVSSNEIKAYYKSHKKMFKQTASRDIEYVVFEVVPSESDISKTSEEMDALLADFATTTNMKTFLLKNSEKQLSAYWYKEGELNTIDSDINTYAFSGATTVSPVFKDGNVFRAAKVMDSSMIPDSVYVKHILLQGTDTAKADSLLNVVKKTPANFSTAAAIYSADKGSVDGGEFGNIGWMTQTYMIPGFESVMTAEVGKPFILKTQYGTHVILVSQKTKPVLKKQVAILEKTSLASKETFNDFYAQANTFATLANGSYEGYKKAVDSTKVYSHPMSRISEATSSYGAVDQAKEVTRWVFDAKKGKASNIITVNNNFFFVVTVKGIHKEGYTPIEEAAASIKQEIFTNKLREKSQADVAAKIAGMETIEAVAEAYNTTVITRNGESFSYYGAKSTEPALAGALLVAETGKIGTPVAGMSCTYVYKINNREKGAFYTAEDAKSYEAQKAQYTSQMIAPEMMTISGVKDNRARFY